MNGYKINVAVIPKGQEEAFIEEMNKSTREWTDRASRGECGWVCADCCGYDPNGMPDECFHGHQQCTEIIQRDKRKAMRESNEPS
ncbi:hypothetical protein [Azotobacter salinestris]|uniref:hypothetical protein n=1 Tax=Azotobacter salinestris TaxID=69964 RepID=UPI0032DFB112